ncbi:MAG: barstar family protein [Chromatiales bacterium]|nr:barstar family protein [Chromatiales bacterium]
MKTLTIDGRKTRSPGEFYRQARELFELDEDFGNNLDALWDVLSTDVAGPLKIRWRHTRVARRSLGDDFERLVSVLERAAEERDDLILRVYP